MAKLQPTISAGRSATPQTLAPTGTDSLTDRVARIIEMIRPAVQADGGDVEFLGITSDPEHHARIRLHGACVGCPSAAVTLQLGIERNLREYVPEIRGIVVVD